MNKKFITNIVLVLVLVVLASLNAYAVCTVTLDKATYFVGETATATMVCSGSEEQNRAYTVTWRNGTTTLETDAGTTPAIAGSQFFDSYSVTGVFTTGTVNLTGTNLEGGDTFTSTVAPANALIIANASSRSVGLIGLGGCLHFDTLMNSGLLSGVLCQADVHDIDGFTIFDSDEIKTYNGHGSFCTSVPGNFFSEDTQYEGDVNCFFDNLSLIASATTEFSLNISHWLTVNTITDKLEYTLSDKEVLVCANITNNNTFRIPLSIHYDYRCDGSSADTDRIVIDSHDEIRGISANTTQNQCAPLKILNLKTMANSVNICYASTIVEVLPITDITGPILISYPTTSPTFNITSTSSAVFTEGDNMGALAITIFILLVAGSLFSLPFIIERFTKNEYTNLIIKRACFVIGIYLMMFNSAIMATIAEATGLPLTAEMFQYMWMFGMVGYVSMGFLVFKTLLDTMNLWKLNKENARTQ